MTGLPQESLKQLKFFITYLKSHPDLLHTPELSFFKEYLESLGAKLPAKPEAKAEAHTPPKPQAQPQQPQQPPKEEPKPEPKPQPKTEPKPQPQPEEKVEEMDTDEPAEPEDPNLWPPDADAESLFLGDPGKQVSDEDMEAANDLLSEARSAARDGNHHEAILKLTEAIKRNPTQSNLFAFRAEYLLSQKKPNAAIRDANRALELNPDSSRGFKIRGKARRYLGKYLEAHYDLSQGNSLDWDDSTVVLIKEIAERAERAKQRARKDEEKQRIEQLKREAAEKRRRQQEEEDRQQHSGGGGGGGFEGFGDILGQLNDPEIQAILKSHPDIPAKVMKAVSGDASAMADPNVQKIIQKLQASFSSGGFGGGMGGAPPPQTGGHSHTGGHGHSHGAGGHSHAAHPKTDDDDLD
jgi:suppressor of tumorigenicity protein 13